MPPVSPTQPAEGRPGSGGPVAVIGAAGFIGQHLVAGLVAAGRSVASYTRELPFRSPDGQPAPGLAVARTVYWLASIINPQLAQDAERVAADRRAFEEYLDLLDAHTLTPTVVVLSSGGTVYDPGTPAPYREDSPTGPQSAYGIAKLTMERTLVTRCPDRGVTLRVANAYGPGQPVAPGQGVIAHWLAAAAAGLPIEIFGDPATTRDYVYTGDLVAALVAVDSAVRERRALPPVVNIGSGVPTSLQELAEIVLDVVGVPGLQIAHHERRSFDLPHTWLEVGLARRVLGWAPTTPLPEGIRQAWSAARP